ncbi:MAG: hypothetical protein ABIL09_16100 [Gemmatimonadota bacterium]
MAIKTAADLWAVWEGGLRGSSMGREDLCQEARAILLDLCGTMSLHYGQAKRRAWVAKSLRGRLFNLVRAEVYDRPGQVAADLDGFPADSSEIPPLCSRISLTFKGTEGDFCRRVLAGDSLDAARREVGWSRAEMAAALGRMRRQLEE